MKNLICLISLTLFLGACNNLSNVTPPAAVTPTLTATLTLEVLPTAALTPSPPLAPAAETDPTPTATPSLPEEISQGIPFTLAQQFRVMPDEVKLVNVEPVTWPDDCLGISRRQPCLPGETPGYQMAVDIKGQSYEFHAPATDPFNLRLATGPVVNIESPALLWEGEPILLGLPEAGSCLSLSLTVDGQGALGVCDGPQRAVALTGEQFAQSHLWQDWLTRFAPFEADTPHGRVIIFWGPGSVVASPAWQRALAAWAKLVASELNAGRGGAGWGAVLAWQQPLPDRPGYCQFLSVQTYGWATASTARCEGGDPQDLGQGWIEPAAWEQFDDWFYNRAPVTTESVSFFGVGSTEMSQAEISALGQWASTLYTGQSPQSRPRNRLTFFPLPQEEGYMRALAVNPDDRLWVAGAINLYLFDPSGSTPTWTNVTTENGGPDGVKALLVDKQGQLWAGSSTGVSLFDGERWLLYDAAAGLTGDLVLALAADSNGDIWAGTDQSVSRFDGQSWQAIRGAPVPALSLAIDLAGRLWVGNADGVHVLDGSTWTAYPEADDFDLMYVNAIAPDPNGNIWVASGACFLAPGDCTNTGLSKFDGQNWTNYLQTYVRGFSGIGPIFAVNFDGAGDGWVGANARFMKFDPQSLPPGVQEDNPAWTSYYPESFEQAGEVHAIVFDQTGNAWAGGRNGVIQLSQE